MISTGNIGVTRMIYKSPRSSYIIRLLLAAIVGAMLVSCAGPGKVRFSSGALSGVEADPRQAVLTFPHGSVEVQDGEIWSSLSTTGEPVVLVAGQRVRTGALSGVQLSFADGSRVDLG